MPGETSDGGGEDINGGQGRHIESLSLIFAQRRCEFFLCSRGRIVDIDRKKEKGHDGETMCGYARRKRFAETCGNRACMIARR
ncbi:hypothetical protein ANTQUA_LOCUS1267 [Anthophora quadrimaculata]